MAKLSFLGGMQTVGATGTLVDTGSERIVLDYGTEIQETKPKFPLSVKDRVDAILLSHSHLDHSGGLGLLKAPVYALRVSKPLTELLLLDSIKIGRKEGIKLPFTRKDVRATINNFSSVAYHSPFRIKKVWAAFYDAGHIPGSSMHFLDFGDKTLLYTGDLNTKDTRLVKGIDLDLPEVDVLVTESTYSDREHPDRKDQEKQLIRTVRDTLAVDGICLIPSFAISRAQEILLVLDKYGIDYPLYMDGMTKKATTIINRHTKLLKEPKALDKALEKVEYVRSNRKREKVIREPCVIVTTSGMLSGGPITYYIKKLYERENCSLVMVGYQVEGTPGKILLESGRYIREGLDLDVQMSVKRLDFSSHAGRTELFKFIKKVSPERVFCVHGDHTKEFARELNEMGFDAIAPAANNRVFVI